MKRVASDNEKALTEKLAKKIKKEGRAQSKLGGS